MSRNATRRYAEGLSVADSPRLAGENAEHSRALAEFDGYLPPIVVHRETMRVIDGRHRVAAARRRGRSEIEVVFADGDDPFVLAVQANVKHGLPLTVADRKAAARRIIASYPQWSDRRIASVAGLAPTTVGSLRNRSTGRSGHSNTRQGRDGVDRPLSTAAGRRLAGALFSERPGASIREVAALVGIAPSTVHDVRRRLREGRDPVPASQREAGERPGCSRAAGGGADVSVAEIGVDPALRHTEGGRVLLRLLNTQAVLQRRLAQLIEVVPRHLAGSVAVLARRTGDAWHSFSDGLESATPAGLRSGEEQVTHG